MKRRIIAIITLVIFLMGVPTEGAFSHWQERWDERGYPHDIGGLYRNCVAFNGENR